MITVKIMGGLGNQMFQYALARKLQSTGKKVRLDISYYDTIPNGDTSRKNWTKNFQHSFKEIHNTNSLKEKGRKLFAKIRGKRYTIVETNPNFSPLILNIDMGYLIGYWQTEKYFKDISKVIKKDFTFDIESLSEQEKEILKKIKKEEMPVALHIRRGDYLSSENQKRFGNICTAEYYEKSITYMMERVKNCKFYIFTDDPKEVKNILPDNIPYEIISDGRNNEWFELFLMSQCKHNIIANSSFSWWGAWLNENNDKIIVAPRYWTNQNDCYDIYCEGWIRI